MKIKDFLAQNPWEETFELLCREPPAPEDLSLDVAAGLIQQERESQIPSLIPLMLSPLVESRSHNVPKGQPSTKRDRWGVHRLREPRRTARLFIEHAVRSGKDLRHYEIAHLMQLRADDAALGRLLRLLSIAGDSSLRMRQALADEWRNVTGWDADFGPVLGPMVSEAEQGTDAPSVHHLTAQLALTLKLETGAVSAPSKRSDGLLQWVSTLAREGRERISELRAEDH